MIAEYRKYHEADTIWPEVVDNIRSQGIVREAISLAGNRMVMILENTNDFSFETKTASDQANPKMRA
jgi:L-rhamnose mutarotase